MIQKVLERRREDLEQRMEQLLQTMERRTGCEPWEAERLLARWDEMNQEYDEVMGKLTQRNASAGA